MNNGLVVRYIIFYANTIQIVKTTLWQSVKQIYAKKLFSGWWYSSVMQQSLAIALDSDVYA